MTGMSLIQPWIVVGIIVLAIIFLFRILSKHSIISLFKNNFFNFFLFVFLALFIISAVNIHSTYSFDFSTLDGWKSFAKVYLSWLGQVAGNLAKITGYIVQQEWVFKTNSTG